jgi:UDP-3-O-[3-hydroxymyristoyl] N-acetylglucosamine deacetylase / 3-hydroxyacyl-[acyl-carrier-protein] dehydratase
MSRQRTIARDATVSGIGLHSGEACTLTFRPAPVGAGRVFVRADLPGRPAIASHPDRLCQRMRRTALAQTVAGVDVEVHTTEHLLAACQGLGIDNLVIELSAVELPGLDGSAKDFCDVLRGAGIVEQDAPRAVFDVQAPVSAGDGKASIIALPYADGLKITYTLDDHGGALPAPQMVELDLTEQTFTERIAPARTFCMAKEVEMLRAAGLGKGATYQNTCVYDGTRIIDNTLRFPDEAARHKVLDLIGDLAHVARHLHAHIVAVRTGHRENMLLVQELNRRIRAAEQPAVVFDIGRILDLLPHRYPMLLVDRIISYEPGVRIVGVKNVTANEPWATGHFPGRPVMPGVLQLEAMSQVGACLLLNELPAQDRAGGKLPFLMSMDKVKFRRPVRPGDQMRMECTVLRLRSTMSACAVKTTVDGQLCAEAEIRCMMA